MSLENHSVNKLSLCWGSLDGVAYPEFLSAASEAGFEAVTLNSALYRQATASGLSDTDITASLRDQGLQVSGIDPLFNWLPGSVVLDGSDSISVCTQVSMEEVFHLAHVAETDLVNAPLGLAIASSEQEIVDGFGILCEKAKRESLRVSLEFMPFNQVPDLETAFRIVEQAGYSNGGIMVDCWHLHRGGGMADDLLEIPGNRIFAMQIDDALSEPLPDIIEETMNQRLPPGDGCIDLARVVRNLRSIGAAVYVDVEVFNESLRALPAVQRARRLYDATAAVLGQA
ncbi:sugar phosphate isomerase/epimerase family protein [Candidatus Marimicrobium litorale]|uniref:Sugar phosphate isomerase/epimerase n=1 Tax=Candidatus Marimicrobium litorale TaxID=2518991 RepID=A0ABT3T8I1_9GAMM|nr:sugar phosphate isomerase/epimerase [Candidatus Marimicrobium litorale]MCX2978565.1 sugar phosphate isomerase/epimerase [Candidatus Marimicrobium litorale]